jgi:hypothetical protein
MDLNNIQLSGSQLAGLYTSTLVELDGEKVNAVIPQPAPAADIRAETPAVLGQNARGILIVTSDPSAPFLADADLAFLTNVLGACNLGLGDVAILNWLRMEDPKGVEIAAHLNATKVLLFQVTPGVFGLPANFPAFQVQALGGRTYLHAPALPQIAADKELKKSLWLSLKKLFDV